MKRFVQQVLLAVSLSGFLLAQQPATVSTTKASVVPNLVRFSGTASDVNNKSGNPAIGITFALYKDQQGGAPLWVETQNVSVDRSGHYSVSLGGTKAEGVPSELFSSGEAKWLGVQIEGHSEQPRVLLLSVPYALKAADAETIGGLPPSAFMLATPTKIRASAASTDANANNASAPPSSAVTGTGTVNFLPLWDTASDIISSAVSQTGTGATAKVGVNNTAPASTLDVKGGTTLRGTVSLPATGAATATAGKSSQSLNMVASSFNSGTSTAVNQTFQWKAEPANNNSANPSGVLNLLYGQGATAPAETGLRIGPKGVIAFSPGQTFPGTGTITGITAGSGLSGGGTSGNVTLTLNTATTDGRYAQLGTANAFTKNNTFAGLVGIGTAAPGAQLDVEAPSTNPVGIVGATTSTQFFAAGIVGHATGASGETRGVYGVSDSPSGIGVHGIAAIGGQFETGNGTIFVGRGQGATRVTIDSLGNTNTSGALNAGGSINAGGGFFSSVTGGTTAVFASSDTGTGLFASGGTGVIGESSTGNAIYGSNGSGGSGVVGTNGGKGQGVFGTATGSSGQGVRGESFGTSASSGLGPDGVDGITHSAAGSGVAGINDAFGGTGVYGVSRNGGFGFVTPSNVQQGLGAGGWVKAMVFVDPFTSNGTAITRCYNSQVNGSNSNTPPCGFTILHEQQGQDLIDFGFTVNDRFVSATLFGGNGISTCVSDPDNSCLADGLFPLSSSQVLTETTVGLGAAVDVAFWVIVF
ncbi:MAG TPA: hypothetical protein VFE61_09935 [Candidatus Sulfotelmatobacter sp.]|nr:hypothetical protein [Candidatus Sulfotelmatobacter sp.]